MIAKVERRGDAYVLRISKADAEREGLRPGDEIIIELKTRSRQKVDLSHLRTFSMGGLASHHDEAEWA